MIPVVEGLLLEPHNSHLLTLLYRLAEWHALAKLRMHTEVTLELLEQATVTIGKELRSFRDTSSAAYTCKELPGETSRRIHRQRKTHAKKTTLPNVASHASETAIPPAPLSTQAPVQDTTYSFPDLPPKTKLLNLCTYKLHALGDYVRTIRLFGTTDSYSTQIASQIYPVYSMI